jgi:hypothetical protein
VKRYCGERILSRVREGADRQLSTLRPGIGPTPGFGEGEYLLFYLIGMPGEVLEAVP